MIIKILAEGGEMKPGPALSQKLGPAGINLGQVISKVNDATKNFKGMKVPVELDVNSSTKEFTVKIFSPPVSELLKKELKIPKGSGLQKQAKVANASIEDIIKVAITKFPNMLCNNIKTAVKTVAGSCVSLGILIENKPAAEIEADIEGGKFDKEINSEKIETDPEKRKSLDEFFNDLKNKQDQLMKQQQAAKDAEAEKEEKKTEKAKK